MKTIYPLRLILPLILILLSIPMLVASYLHETGHAEKQINELLRQRSSHTSSQLASLVRDALLQNDKARIQRTLQSVITQPNLLWAVMLDENHTVIFSTDYRLDKWSIDQLPDADSHSQFTTLHDGITSKTYFNADQSTLYAVYPLYLDLQKRTGHILLSYDAQTLRNTARHEARLRAIHIAFAILLLAGLIWLYLHWFLVRRIERLATEIQQNRDLQIPWTGIKGNDEITRLSDAFIQLAGHLRQQNTELQKEELRSRQLSQFFSLLSETNATIARSTSIDELLSHVCDIAVGIDDIAAAWIGILDEEGKYVVPSASANVPDEYLAALIIPMDADNPLGQGPTGKALRSGKHHISNDFLADTDNLAWHALARKAGLQGSAAFPLHHENRVVGVLNFYTTEVNMFNDKLVQLLDGMARDISFAMDSFQSEARRKQAEIRLAEHSHHLDERVKELQTLFVANEVMAQHDLDMDNKLQQITSLLLAAMHNQKHAWAKIMLDGQTYSAGIEGKQAQVTAPILQANTVIGHIHAGCSHDEHNCTLHTKQNLLSILATQIARLHAEQLANEQLELAGLVFENSHEMIIITDARQHVLSINKAFTRISGYTEEELLGKHIRTIKSGRQDRAFYADMWREISEVGHWQGELWNRNKAGELYPVLSSITAVYKQGALTHYISVATDISRYKQAEERIRYLAYYDPLTELPNRTLLKDRARQILYKAEHDGTNAAFLFLDLDHFKTINESLGHLSGDELLQEVAYRINRILLHTDTFGRIGGDEFLVILDGTNAANAVQLAHKLLAALAQSFVISNHSINISASIGIAIYPNDGNHFHDLLKNSEIAMHKAKDLGRNQYYFFTPDLNEAALERFTLESALRVALEKKQFCLHYQPQVDTASQQIIGVEALLRWQHPEFGFISPGKFIPIAEDSNLIGKIGAWVIREACRQGTTWQQTGLPGMIISVNVSVRQFTQSDILAEVRQALTDSGLPAGQLELEITESLLVHDLDNTLTLLRRLHDLGVRIAVDDFGTGYSSLAYLKRFPIDKLKLDQSFVRDLVDDMDDRAVSAGIISLGHSLDMVVIAEGVETAEQLDILRELGCDEIQGYYYSKPLPASELQDWLAGYGQRFPS